MLVGLILIAFAVIVGSGLVAKPIRVETEQTLLDDAGLLVGNPDIVYDMVSVYEPMWWALHWRRTRGRHPQIAVIRDDRYTVYTWVRS